jgi:flagella basal body P-ring formation protein FlgA
MIWAFLVLALLGQERLVLKEKAQVGGRFLRLVDLLDIDQTSEAARAELAEIYLGPAPEEGKVRTVSADEIRRELERRSIDPAAFVLSGEKVVVSGGGSPASDALRRAIAFEIKRYLLDREAGFRATELTVRIGSLHPEDLPPTAEIVEVRPRSPEAKSEFVVQVMDPADKKTVEVVVIARLLRSRDVAFAVRDLGVHRAIERADVEFRRIDVAGDENYVDEWAALAGATTLVRVRKGAPIAASDLRLKPALRRGDVVRAFSPTFEVDARALEDGALGQEIQLEYVTSKNRFRGRVGGAARVDVVEVGK